MELADRKSAIDYFAYQGYDCVLLLSAKCLELKFDLSPAEVIICLDYDTDCLKYLKKETRLEFYRIISSDTAEEVMYDNIKKKLYSDRLVQKTIGLTKTTKRVTNYMYKRDIINTITSCTPDMVELGELVIDDVLNAGEFELSVLNFENFTKNLNLNSKTVKKEIEPEDGETETNPSIMNEPINSLYPEDINEEINNRKRKRDEDLIDLQLKKTKNR